MATLFKRFEKNAKDECRRFRYIRIDEILSSILELPLEIDGHYAILPDALNIARKYNITVCDALFLAVARKRKARLITADHKLAKVFNIF